MGMAQNSQVLFSASPSAEPGLPIMPNYSIFSDILLGCYPVPITPLTVWNLSGSGGFNQDDKEFRRLGKPQ
jgi:hypothetical protein